MRLPIASYSFFNALENCPHKAFEIYVARSIPYVESPEMAWGNAVHKAFELRIRDGIPLPEEMQAGEKTAAQFHEYSKSLPVRIEYQLAMTRDGQPCEWKAGDAWFRGKLDCVVGNRTVEQASTFAWMVDWKTGNVREDPFELEAGALLLKIHQPSLEDIRGEYFWLKTGTTGLRYTLTNHQQTYEKLLNLWAEVETYFKAGEWPKRKNSLCGWCAVKTCEHCFDARAGEKAKRRCQF